MLPALVTVPVAMQSALYRQILAMDYYDSDHTRLDVGAWLVQDAEASVRCWMESGDTEPTPAEYLREFEQELEAGMYPAVYPPPLAREGKEPPSVLQPALSNVPPLDVSFGLTPAQYRLVQRAAVADGYAADDVDLFALAALRSWTVETLSTTVGLGDDVAEATWEEAEEAGGRGNGAPGRCVVELDDLASATLLRVIREGSPEQHSGEDPRDLVSAAVTFYLSEDDHDEHGGFSLTDGGEALARAKQDRLAGEGKGEA